MTQPTPCADRSNDPQDWFIRQDGRQYSDDRFLTETERLNVARSVLIRDGDTEESLEARITSAIAAASANRKRAAITRRLQAKLACGPCPMREACLGQALDRGEIHGTWGGFFEEEIAEIRKEQARRRRRRITA